MKIVFGIMSAVHSVESVNQLARSLAPWPVVIHHDFSQTPEFNVDQPNVTFVPKPMKTGWAVWGFSQGVLHLLEHCLRVEQADYFQLLSPTCLPVRPLEQFAAHVGSSTADVNISVADISADRDLLMNFGFRAFSPAESFRFRTLRKLRSAYFGKDARGEPIANMQTLRRSAAPLSFCGSLAYTATRFAQRGWVGSHCFQDELRPLIGGTWLGCKREAGLYLLSRMRDERVRRFFSRMSIPDEMLFASIFGSSGLKIAESNHMISRFDEGNPRWFQPADLNTIFASGKYFARKFPDDLNCPVRRAVLARIKPDTPTNCNSRAVGLMHPQSDLAPVGSSN